jgi:hypothetical protein
VSPGYDYAEGEVPVPAERCTRCGGPLEPVGARSAGNPTGWFRPSRLNKAIWIFQSKGEPPQGERSSLYCPRCSRTFTLLPSTS